MEWLQLCGELLAGVSVSGAREQHVVDGVPQLALVALSVRADVEVSRGWRWSLVELLRVIRGCRVYGRLTGWCRERWGLFGWPLMALQWRQRVEGNSRLSVCVCESLSVSQCDCVAWVDE